MDGSVAIVGAGIGGLAMALSLHARGVPVTVYEQAPELREVGAAVALSANGLRPLGELGLLDDLDAVATEPTELILAITIDGLRGDIPFRLADRFGQGGFRYLMANGVGL